nr:integrase core domain-containing protein [Pantoea allii]
MNGTTIRSLNSSAQPFKVSDSHGLYLLVNPGGSRLWYLKYRINRKESRLGLGAYPDVSLADARQQRDGNGLELILLALAQWAEDHGVMLEFIKPGKPTQNAFIERFNRTYRTEILDFYLFRTLNEAREITERWLNEYNSERTHESLNNLTPEEYRLMAEKPEISKSMWN